MSPSFWYFLWSALKKTIPVKFDLRPAASLDLIHWKSETLTLAGAVQVQSVWPEDVIEGGNDVYTVLHGDLNEQFLIKSLIDFPAHGCVRVDRVGEKFQL